MSIDITLLTKVPIVKAMIFPVVMYGCESWSIRKAELQRTDAFELWCWRRLLRIPWTLPCKEIKLVNTKGNYSWIFIGRADAKAPILWPPNMKNWLTGKDPDAGKDWRQKVRRGQQSWDSWMASLTQWTWICTNFKNSGRRKEPGLLQSMEKSDMT